MSAPIPSGAAISATDARALTDQIKVAVEATWELVKRAYIERAWAALGYDGWDDYCTREFGTSRLRLPREERSEVVASLRESGLSVRAIASATGMSYGTVQSEVIKTDHVPEVTGTDGKTYTPTAPKPAPTTELNDYIAEQGLTDVVANGIECSSCEGSFNPDLITELDTETLLCPDCLDEWDTTTVEQPTPPLPEPQQTPAPRRRPITDAFNSATYELQRSVEKVTRLTADDRLEKNKDQISGANLSDLIRVRDALNGVINTLEG